MVFSALVLLHGFAVIGTDFEVTLVGKIGCLNTANDSFIWSSRVKNRIILSIIYEMALFFLID